MSLHKHALKENPIDGRSSPATDSSGSETSLPRTPSASTAFFPLDLPQFSSLEDEIPDAWKSPLFDKNDSVSRTDLTVHDQLARDSVIEGLLDQIALLRQKVRSLGDDNSRLRRELLRKRSQELMLYESNNSHDQPGASFNDIRLVTQRVTPPEGEVKIGSPKESNLSAYSYYRNAEYFQSFRTVRRRAMTTPTPPEHVISIWGSLKRQRRHSLLTPKQLISYAESRPREEDKPVLSPRVRRLISLKYPGPAEQEASDACPSEDIILPHLWHSDEEANVSPPLDTKDNTISLKPVNPVMRRPQSRIRLSVLEPIFRCFSCSQQRFSHCIYTDGVWLIDRYIKFGFFEATSYQAVLNSWLLTLGQSIQHSHNSEGSHGEATLRHLIGDVLDEVDDSSGDESPSVAKHSEMDSGSTPTLEAYLHSNGIATNDVQRRRERHIALLDSIVEEEELEDTSSSEPFESSLPPTPLTTEPSWSLRPTFASKLTGSTLPSIAEYEDLSDSMVHIDLPSSDRRDGDDFSQGESKEHVDIRRL